MAEQAHTPTPWHMGVHPRQAVLGSYEGKEEVVADLQNAAWPGCRWERNAVFIVHACNNHDALMGALLDIANAAVKRSSLEDIYSLARAALIKAQPEAALTPTPAAAPATSTETG